jgi:regulator of cell morphogenesis and NO signaling
MKILDVTKLEPKFKHSTIFEQFDTLLQGESFVIHNGHDPKPLYYQMIAERGQTFDWEYLLEGPYFWEVKISKLNVGEKATTIGELVANDYRKAEVFNKFGLNYNCDWKKSLKEACNEKGIDNKEVTTALAEVEHKAKALALDYNSWELDFLVEYIINVHHKYVRENVNMLYEYSDKVAGRHGNNHPEVITIAQLYKKIAENLKLHIQDEEIFLFPYIKNLVMAKREKHKMEKSNFENIASEIKLMENQHVIVSEFMSEIRQISNGFTAPKDACSSFKVLYSKLDEFEKNLQQHYHLENNILFPKVIKLEKELYR